MRLAPSLAAFVLALATPVSRTVAQQPASAPALDGAARWADSARRSIEGAQLSGDSAALAAARAVADRALGAWPDHALLLHYAGYARYRQAMRIVGDPKAEDRARALLEEAVDLLQRSHARRPLAETQALLSSSYGTMIGESMLRGMRYGPSASRTGDEAMRLGPRNPRVLLLAAIGAFHTPSMWGGGRDKARTLLAQAIAAFENDAPAAPLPAWGRAEAYAWLGQLESAAKRPDAARAAYERALALAPSYAWVRDVLLPQVAAAR